MFARGIAAPCDRRASGSSTGGTKRRGPDRLSRRWWRFSRPGQRDGAARRDSTGHPRGFQSVGRATSAALGASEPNPTGERTARVLAGYRRDGNRARPWSGAPPRFR